MSNPTLSRVPATPAPSPTLATLLARVIEDPTLSQRQRHDLASALRTVARGLGRRLEDLPAYPRQLAERVRNFVPAMAGITAKRWKNAMSLTRSALKHAGFISLPSRACVTLAPEWQLLFQKLPESDTANKRARIGLSRFARYCTTRSIAPDEVDDAVFAAYLEDLTTGSMSKAPRKLQRTAAVIWTRLAKAIPTWPQQPITIPDYRRCHFSKPTAVVCQSRLH